MAQYARDLGFCKWTDYIVKVFGKLCVTTDKRQLYAQNRGDNAHPASFALTHNVQRCPETCESLVHPKLWTDHQQTVPLL